MILRRLALFCAVLIAATTSALLAVNPPFVLLGGGADSLRLDLPMPPVLPSAQVAKP